MVNGLKRISIGIFWGCLLLPVWNAVVSVGWKILVLLVGWVGKCCSELGT